MKYASFILLLVIFSCRKIDQAPSLSKEPGTYRFETASEDGYDYEIQTSMDGVNFSTVKIVHYSADSLGKYSVDLPLSKKEMVRTRTINDAGQPVYSGIFINSGR